MNRFWFLACSLLLSIEKPEAIVGTWRGTSICVDKATDRACKDEQVIYRITPRSGVPDTVRVAAFRIVASDTQSMGDLDLGLRIQTHSWVKTFTVRGGMRVEWEFFPHDSTMSGTLVELPSKRLIRSVSASRLSK